jgi:hypothetical protein
MIEVVNVNIRFPEEIHKQFKQIHKECMPHMSFNALVIEAVREYVGKAQERQAIRDGKTQISPECVKRS